MSDAAPFGQHTTLGSGRVHRVTDDGAVWISRGYRVYVSRDHGASFRLRAAFTPDKLRAQAVRHRLTERLTRAGFHSVLPLPDGSVIATVRNQILRCGPDETVFRSVLSRPGRSFRPERTPDGEIFAGEYFYNKARSEVLIFASSDDGQTWETRHRFAPGDVRHVHAIRWDRFREGLIVLTGDLGDENRILFSDDGLNTTRQVAGGTQRARAYDVISTDAGYYLPTDTQYEQNYVQFMTPAGELAPLVPIAGSCLAATGVGDTCVFGTAAEPSEVNLDPRPTLYATVDGVHWNVVERWVADRFSGGSVRKAALFQMPRVLLPEGSTAASEYLYATTVAVRGQDGTLHRWTRSPS